MAPLTTRAYANHESNVIKLFLQYAPAKNIHLNAVCLPDYAGNFR
jgi:hypothetical protein